MLRDVCRQHLDLELAEHVVQHAAEVAHAVGDADEADRHLDGDLLVAAHLVEVDVDDLGGRSGSRWISRMSALTGARPSTVTSTIVVAALIPTSIFLRVARVDRDGLGSRPCP